MDVVEVNFKFISLLIQQRSIHRRVEKPRRFRGEFVIYIDSGEKPSWFDNLSVISSLFILNNYSFQLNLPHE